MTTIVTYTDVKRRERSIKADSDGMIRVEANGRERVELHTARGLLVLTFTDKGDVELTGENIVARQTGTDNVTIRF